MEEERYKLYFDWVIHNEGLNPDRSPTITEEVLKRLSHTIVEIYLYSRYNYDDLIDYASTHKKHGVTEEDFIRTMNIVDKKLKNQTLKVNNITELWIKIYEETKAPYDYLTPPLHSPAGRKKKTNRNKRKSSKRKSYRRKK